MDSNWRRPAIIVKKRNYKKWIPRKRNQIKKSKSKYIDYSHTNSFFYKPPNYDRTVWTLTDIFKEYRKKLTSSVYQL